MYECCTFQYFDGLKWAGCWAEKAGWIFHFQNEGQGASCFSALLGVVLGLCEHYENMSM